MDLEEPANSHLLDLRVGSDAVTVRHLLTHTAGVSSKFEHFLDEVPATKDVLGPVVSVEFEPGSRRQYSNGGYTVLGEVIAGATGRPYAEVVAERVLGPLQMGSSRLVERWPDDLVAGWAVPVDRKVPSVPAAGGLLTTVGDLGRFVAGWRSLLSEALAVAAMCPQADRNGGHQGFGWLLSEWGDRRIAGHAGGVLGYRSSLLWAPDEGLCTVAMANCEADVEPINTALLQAMLGS